MEMSPVNGNCISRLDNTLSTTQIRLMMDTYVAVYNRGARFNFVSFQLLQGKSLV